MQIGSGGRPPWFLGSGHSHLLELVLHPVTQPTMPGPPHPFGCPHLTVRNASSTRTYSFLSASWAGDMLQFTFPFSYLDLHPVPLDLIFTSLTPPRHPITPPPRHPIDLSLYRPRSRPCPCPCQVLTLFLPRHLAISSSSSPRHLITMTPRHLITPPP